MTTRWLAGLAVVAALALPSSPRTGGLVSADDAARGVPGAPVTAADGQQQRRVTWSMDIAPLLQEHCQGCHREGNIAPFALIDYADAYRERRKIARAVERRRMPPWKPLPGFGEFVGAIAAS